MDFESILAKVVFNNTVEMYIEAFFIFLLFVGLFRLFKVFLLKRLERLAARTLVTFDDLLVRIIESIHWPAYVLGSLYWALRYLQLPSFLDKVLGIFGLALVVFYVARAVQAIISYAIESYVGYEQRKDPDTDYSIFSILGKFLSVIIWATAVLFLLSNLGYNVSTILAGFGIGGLAVAFALQHVLADVFASVSIYFDKPFKKGDFIIIGNDMGTVRHVGIKTTRIETLQGQELVVSNKELTESRINNYKQMERRRVVFNFGLEYETPVKKLKMVPGIIADVISEVKQATLDRVHFSKFGDFSLNCEIVYYVESPDYNLYMDIQQEINLRILETFETHKLRMAYPAERLILERSTSDRAIVKLV